MPRRRAFGALTFLVGPLLACDWFGAREDRRLGDPIQLGEWTLEIRRSVWNSGIPLKGGDESRCVSTDILVVGDGRPRAPEGSHRGLCGECFRDPDRSEARAAAEALYEKDPALEHCVDPAAGILAAACLEGDVDPPVWLIVHAQKNRVVWENNVNVATCAEALQAALAARPLGPPS